MSETRKICFRGVFPVSIPCFRRICDGDFTQRLRREPNLCKYFRNEGEIDILASNRLNAAEVPSVEKKDGGKEKEDSAKEF